MQQFGAEFRSSWRNENPTRNRKPDPSNPAIIVPLRHNTEVRTIADLRAFLKFCMSREWLSDNWASKQHGMKTTPIIEQKEPFTGTEEAYIYRAAELVTDGKGFRVVAQIQVIC